MRKYLMLAGLLAGLSGASAAFADDDCHVPKADWQPREAVEALAESQGWSVRKIGTDDGCYEIKGQDAQGQKIKAKIDPGTLMIVKFKYADYECQVPMSDWQSRESVETLAEQKGWVVRRIKTDDGCYKIKGFDAQGRKIEAKIDPGSLKVVKFKNKGFGDDDRARAKSPAMTGTKQAPANGLFTPGSKPVVE